MSIRERWDRWWNIGKYQIKWLYLRAYDQPGYPLIGVLELDRALDRDDTQPVWTEWDRLVLGGAPIYDGMRVIARTPAGEHIGATFIKAAK